MKTKMAQAFLALVALASSGAIAQTQQIFDPNAATIAGGVVAPAARQLGEQPAIFSQGNACTTYRFDNTQPGFVQGTGAQPGPRIHINGVYNGR